MRKIKRFLLSRKTVISLICAVGISCVIGSTIPQVTTKTPRFFETWEAKSPKVYYLIDLLQLNQVYTSIWFLVLVALIAFSLILSIYYQSKVLIKSGRPAQRDVTQGSFKNYVALRLVQGSGFRVQGLKVGVEGSGFRVQGSGVRVEELAGKIKEIFEARRYRPHLLAEGSKYFIFGKNRWGRWGGVIFHVGLLFIIVAALYGLAFQKRGFVQLIQADTFQGRDKDWQSERLGFFARDFDLGFQVRLDQFAPTYWENDQVRNLESSLRIIDDKGETREFSLSPGNPIYFKGTKICQRPYYGYCLGFILKREGENEPLGAHFLLDAPAKKDQPFAGKTAFPTTDYVLDVKFHPNLIESSFYATLPGVDLTVTQGGEQRFKGRVLFSQRAWLGKDTLAFAQIYYWTGLIFAKNYGMPLVYLGSALCTLGALLIFMLPYKQVHLKVAEEGDHIELCMGGRTKRYKAIFSEEFKEMGERLEKELQYFGFRNERELRPANVGSTISRIQ